VTFVDDARHAIATLGLERPVLAGHSWGASIALELAVRSRCRDRCRGAWHGRLWGEDLVELVHAGHRTDGDVVVLTLTYEARARILRDLFDLRQDRAWQALAIPAFAAFALRKSDVVLAATKRAAEHIAAVAPKVLIKWYDSPHDIPLSLPGDIASDIAAL